MRTLLLATVVGVSTMASLAAMAEEPSAATTASAAAANVDARASSDAEPDPHPTASIDATWAGSMVGISNGQTMMTKRINPTLVITNLGQAGNAGGYPQVSSWQTSKFSMTMAASASNQFVTASMIVNANARM